MFETAAGFPDCRLVNNITPVGVDVKATPAYTAARHLFHKSVLSVQSKSAHLLCYCTTNSALADNTETVLFPHNPCKSCTNSICAGFFDLLEYVSLKGIFWSPCTATSPSYCSNRACRNRTPPTMTMLSVTGRPLESAWYVEFPWE